MRPAVKIVAVNDSLGGAAANGGSHLVAEASSRSRNRISCRPAIPQKATRGKLRNGHLASVCLITAKQKELTTGFSDIERHMPELLMAGSAASTQRRATYLRPPCGLNTRWSRCCPLQLLVRALARHVCSTLICARCEPEMECGQYEK